ncbi:hypothetical protein [Sphingomonas sp.]|uniref:hypothetical protein n=1 Tax=Sphingomonas sp. TaxID=28214 RepID=UPI001DE0A09A|nr:hypothetical protein [Sphingomonas sp.]MBX9796908.1 hypothetical protein [Sphingomonas sp.]
MIATPPEDAAPLPYVADRALAEEAIAMIAAHGDDACSHVAALAEASRDAGNVVKFCRFRQMERLILTLERPATLRH